MFYYTVKLPRMYHQMSFEDFLSSTGDEEFSSYVKNYKETATRTYVVDKPELINNYRSKTNVYHLVRVLKRFIEIYEPLFSVENRMDLYTEFKIPKKSGGLRTIDAPNTSLKTALSSLKEIFEDDFGALYHTSAFAYIKGRCTVDAIKKHQWNESNWFGKYDLSNFFGSTTLEYVIKMLEMIYPFNFVLENPRGREVLTQALSLAFLNGGLPQGTPISPIITNLIMIPVDYILTQKFRDYNKQNFIYTRYADDFIISSKYEFRFKDIEREIVDTLNSFGAPFTINTKKTRYGSRAGKNFNLGLMLNKDNEITIGHKKKKQFETMLFNFGKDYINGIAWDKADVQTLEGLRSYYKMVEGDTIDKIIYHISEKTKCDIMSAIKTTLGR